MARGGCAARGERVKYDGVHACIAVHLCNRRAPRVSHGVGRMHSAPELPEARAICRRGRGTEVAMSITGGGSKERASGDPPRCVQGCARA